MNNVVKNCFLFAALIFALFAFTATRNTDELTEIITKITNHHDQRPQEKLYVQLDKSFYVAGENIWFKAYLVDAKLHIPDSAVSKVLYVELLNTNKEVLIRHMLYSPAGISYGDFQLPDSLPQGKYLIRAYTNYMKNLDHDFFFYKGFQVFNTDGHEEPTTESESIDVQFFPEGGNLLAGVENRVAFKAINSQGKGIFVEGEIIDDKNKFVTSFKTGHSGMGSFKMFVLSTNKYNAKLKTPLATAEFQLPEVTGKGYMLQVTDAGENLRVYIYSNIDNSTAPVPFILVGQTRGEVYYAAKSDIKSHALTTTISKKKFPTGITQLTLFDGAGVPQCERLVFINHSDTLKFSITADKQSYSKREKVNLDLTVQDYTGKPVTGSFSLSIYQNDGSKQNLNYDPITIENYLRLTSDLKGQIENPGYYLKDKSLQTLSNLDLLMMTHGWRRFLWKTILQNPLTRVDHFAERGITISGKVKKALSNKASKYSKVKILTEQGELLITQTDSIGGFYSDELFYFDSTKIVIQTDNVKGKQAPLQFELYPFNISPLLEYSFAPFEEYDVQDLVAQQEQQMKILALGKDVTLLKEAEVRSTKIERPARAKLYGTPSASIKMADIPTSATYMNVLQALQSRVPGLKVVGTPPNMSVRLFRGYGDPLFLINGTPVDLEAIMSLQPLDVESVDVLAGTSAAAFGNRGMGGVIAVYTKPGANVLRPSIGIQHFKYPGFYSAREFYSPKYNLPTEQSNVPDLRNTLYWNPLIETDEQGKANISFHVGDVLSTYKIVIEGISYGGYPGYYSSTLSVK